MSRASAFSEYAVDVLVRFPLGVVASLAPRRMWPTLDEHLNVSGGTAAWSMALSIFAAGFVLLSRFAAAAPGLNAYSLIFALGSAASGPLGRLAVYLLYLGMFRACQALADEPKGDPLLELIDYAIVRTRRTRSEQRRRLERDALEGPEVPDRLVDGRSVGFPNADLAVMASRRKPEWTKGTVSPRPQ